MKYICQGRFLTTSLDVLWLFSLSLSLTHTSVILAVWNVLAIRFLEMTSIISILFSSLSSSSNSHSPPVKDDKWKLLLMAAPQEDIHTQISTVVPRNVLESKGERKGNKVLLWRYTQARTDQKWCLNLQCFAKKFQIIRPTIPHVAFLYASELTTCITAK